MRIRRMTLLAAVVIATATSLGAAATASAAATPATFVARDDAYGPTLSAATIAARQQLNIDYGPCTNVVLIADSQLSDGTWWAEVAGNCEYFH